MSGVRVEKVMPLGAMLGSGMWRGACMAVGDPYERAVCMLPFIEGCEYLECSDP